MTETVIVISTNSFLLSLDIFKPEIHAKLGLTDHFKL